eukprot:1142940-Pelagomonas_calceolata.AAC.6
MASASARDACTEVRENSNDKRCVGRRLCGRAESWFYQQFGCRQRSGNDEQDMHTSTEMQSLLSPPAMLHHSVQATHLRTQDRPCKQGDTEEKQLDFSQERQPFHQTSSMVRMQRQLPPPHRCLVWSRSRKSSMRIGNHHDKGLEM